MQPLRERNRVLRLWPKCPSGYMYAALDVPSAHSAPPPTLCVASPPGEQWIVRCAARPGEGSFGEEALLCDVVAEAEPSLQCVSVVLPSCTK